MIAPNIVHTNYCCHLTRSDNSWWRCNCKDYPTMQVKCPYGDDGPLAKGLCKFYSMSEIKDLGHGVYGVTINNRKLSDMFSKDELASLAIFIKKWIDDNA